jgi:drug/metabolite transporter (DMT)-like permease
LTFPGYSPRLCEKPGFYLVLFRCGAGFIHPSRDNSAGEWSKIDHQGIHQRERIIMNPQILALLAALAWGVGGYFEKRGLNLGGLSPQMAVTLRTGMALVIITAASLPNLKTLPHASTKSLLMVILGGGIISGSIGMLCYYAAINGPPLS